MFPCAAKYRHSACISRSKVSALTTQDSREIFPYTFWWQTRNLAETHPLCNFLHPLLTHTLCTRTLTGTEVSPEGKTTLMLVLRLQYSSVSKPVRQLATRQFARRQLVTQHLAQQLAFRQKPMWQLTIRQLAMRQWSIWHFASRQLVISNWQFSS